MKTTNYQNETSKTKISAFKKELSHIGVENLRLISILNGNRANKNKSLSVRYFNTITLMKRSRNVNSKEVFIHGIGWSKKENSYTFLILKEIQ